MTTNERCARESGDGVEKLFLCDFFGIDNVVGLANGPYGLDGQDSSASDIAGMDKRKCHMWITEKTDLSAPQQRDNATEHGTVARAIKHARSDDGHIELFYALALPDDFFGFDFRPSIEVSAVRCGRGEVFTNNHIMRWAPIDADTAEVDQTATTGGDHGIANDFRRADGVGNVVRPRGPI